jgi:hypothetical protein
MNVSTLLNKILLEQTEEGKKTQGIDMNNTVGVLQKVQSGCNLEFIKNRPINSMSKGDKLWGMFPGLAKTGKQSLAWVSGKDGNNLIVVLGVQDPNLTSPGLLGFRVTQGQIPTRIEGGVGQGCRELQELSAVGQVMLSAYDESRLKGYMSKRGIAITDYSVVKPENTLGYKEIKMKDLLDDNGKPLLQNPGDGSVWIQTKSGTEKMGNVPKESYEYMSNQGLTTTKPPVGTYAAELGFTLQTLKDDIKSLTVDPNADLSEIYYPDPENPEMQAVLYPNKQACRNAIKKLAVCSKSGGEQEAMKQFGSSCMDRLVVNKFTALSCQNKNFIGGAIGLGDEYEQLLRSTAPTGLFKLNKAKGTAKYSSGIKTESVESRINQLLNEQHRKFTFNKKQDTNELVLEFYKDFYKTVVKDIRNRKRINENILGDISSAFSFNLGGGLTQGIKEQIASYVVKMLGFDDKSYWSKALINAFANVDFKDFPRLFKDCKFASLILTKSLLEAYLDQFAAKSGFDSFIYKALKNIVTETAANTTPFMKLSDLVSKLVCPILQQVESEGLLSSLGGGMSGLMGGGESKTPTAKTPAK